MASRADWMNRCIEWEDLDEDEENFGLCMDFVQSNLKYHRFLDVDDRKISRSIDGLIEKFDVHTQGNKAKALRKLSEDFLEFPLGKYDKTKSDAHYALLSLLLNLSQSPVSVPYVPSAKRAEKEAVDEFDWTSYLLEGIDEYHLPVDDDDSDWSDDDDTLGRKTDIRAKTPESMQLQEVQDRTLQEGFEELMIRDASPVDDHRASLERNVVIKYWKGRVENDPSLQSLHESSNLRADWESFLVRSDILYASPEKTCVTEYHIIREFLWLLSGAKTSFIFHWDGQQFVPNPGSMVSHLTDDTLNNFLRRLSKYGSIVQHLHLYIESLTSRSSSCDEAFVTLTHEAFAASLLSHLQRMKKDLIAMEREISMQEKCHTLASVLNQLEDYLSDLDLLNRLMTNGISSCKHMTSASQRTITLLQETHILLLEVDALGESHVRQLTFLLNLWIKILRPYVEIIDNWISYGNLQDFHHEFIIRRSEDLKSLDEKFWVKAFTLTCSHSDSPLPDFLKPVLNHIIVAGKSVELLQNLGHLNDVIQITKSAKRLPLYELFIHAIGEHLGHLHGDGQSETTSSPPSVSIPAPLSDGVLSQNIQDQLEVEGIRDPLLKINFSNIFQKELATEHSLHNEKDKSLDRSLDDLNLSGLSPTHLLLEQCLYPLIISQYNHVSHALLATLKRDYKLMHHFSIMRKVYLMEAGDMMYDFYTALFEKLRLHEPWQDASFLNITLQESLEFYLPEEKHHLFVDVAPEGTKAAALQPAAALQGLRIHYSVPWPVNMVIHSESVKVYSDVFAFLLQIKRVKFCMDNLSFSDLSEGPSRADDPSRPNAPRDWPRSLQSSIIHRMQVFRMKLMHFVNSLHEYIMTMILQSTGLEFKRDVEKAVDLDQVITAHQRYLSLIHERCLLHERAKFIHNIMMKVLNMALVFAASWELGVNSVSGVLDLCPAVLRSDLLRALLIKDCDLIRGCDTHPTTPGILRFLGSIPLRALSAYSF